MKSQWLICFLLGAVVTLLAVIAFDIPAGQGTAWAGPGSATDSMMALVGGKDREVLFLIDTKNQRLMVYDYDEATSKFALYAARNYQYDVTIPGEIMNKKGFSYEEVRKAAEKGGAGAGN